MDSAQRLRGFGPAGILAILVILAGSLAGPIVSSILILAWAQISETPLRALGLTLPRSWPATLAVGVVIGIVFKLLMKAVVMPLMGAPDINARYHYLAGNPGALPGILFAVLVSAAIGEEIFFRGYLFERSGTRFGQGRAALAGTVLTSTVLFALAHYQDQGVPGVEQAAATGLVFGTVYAWRKQLWVVMAMHAAFDLTAVLLIYRNWEVPVAHWVFR